MLNVDGGLGGMHSKASAAWNECLKAGLHNRQPVTSCYESSTGWRLVLEALCLTYRMVAS